MNPFSNLFMGLGAFLIVAAVVYGVHAGEYEGLTLSVVVAGGALLIGGYLASVVRRARAGLDPGAVVPERTADEEPHVGPTIWPLVFAISAIGLVVGAISSRWALLPGGILFVAAAVGWVRDVHRQWHHHAAAPAGEAHSAGAAGEAHSAGAVGEALSAGAAGEARAAAGADGAAVPDQQMPSGSGVAGTAADHSGVQG